MSNLEVKHTEGDGTDTALGAAFAQAGVKPDDFKTTGAGVAARFKRMADRATILTPEELAAEQLRKHEEGLTRKREMQETVEALNELDGRTKLVCFTALQYHYLLLRRRELSPEEQKTLKEATSLWEEFEAWPVESRRPYMDGMPNAENPDLQKGFNAWVEEQDAARKQAYEERRNEQNAERQKLADMATTRNLHEGVASGCAVVYVDEHYIRRRYDEATKRMVSVQKTDGTGPQTRRGTFLLTITASGRNGYGQILRGTVNMPFVKDTPHPDKPVPLHPERDFATDQGEPFFHRTVQEMLAAKWGREEREAKETAERAERRHVDTTMAKLMATGTGHAVGYAYMANSRRRAQAGWITMWLEGLDGRLYLRDFEIRTPQNKQPFELAFPQDGLVLKPGENEPGTVRFIRGVLAKMVQEGEAVSAYERMTEAHPSTVANMGDLLDATSKQTLTAKIQNWNNGRGVVLSVENTGRGKGRKVRVVDCFSPEERFIVPEGTEVPATLNLEEDATPEQSMLASMLRHLSGRRYEQQAKVESAPPEPEGDSSSAAADEKTEATKTELAPEEVTAKV